MSGNIVTWALEIEYDGTPFMGWQRQKHGLAIQQVLEEAASKICNGKIPPATASGRTDAGVHARAQIVQIELPDFPPYRIREALNYHLKPHPVVVLRAGHAPPGWNARFSAISRIYQYIISNRAPFPALEVNRLWHVRQPLDEARMNKAAQALLGHHDFSAFRASACQAKSPIRTLDELSITRAGDKLFIHAKARSFLHHQVRNMAGSLVLIGDGTWPISRMGEILAGKDRAAAGPTAPPHGLYLNEIGYPEPLPLL